MHRYIPILAKNAGFRRIGEKVVEHRERKYGVSKFGLERMLKGYLDLITVTFMSRFGRSPMYFFGGLGTLMFLLGGMLLGLGGLLGLTLYYRSNFPVNTWINGVYCTGKSIEQVNEELVSAQEASVITIVDADCVNWEIDMLAADIRPDYSDALKAYLKKNASAFWMDNLKVPYPAI